MAETKIVLNRQSDLILDNANITAPVGIVVADIAGLESAILSIDTAESAHMSAEVSSRISGDDSLAANLSTELIDRAAAVSTEASIRLAGDQSIAANLSQELIDRAAAVSAEVSNRISGDDSLDAKLSTEVSNRVEGDVSVTAAMSAEISTRIVAETSLQNNIDAEESSRIVADQAEESRAIAAETSLAADLDAEQSRAESAEASLNAKVENVISNVDPAALDSLTEIVGAFQSADGDLNGAITALSSTATAAVDNEASIRLAADQSLAGDLSSEIADREAAVSLEEAARISGDASVNADLSTEIEARISDVNAEQARAESAEAILTAGLSSELVDRAAAVSAEESARIAGDASIAANLSTELVARASAEAAEASIRLAADQSLSLDLDNEAEARIAAVSAEASSRLSADASIAADLSSELVARASAVTAEASSRLSADTSIAAGLSSELVARASADSSLAATLSAANSSIEAMPYTDGTTIIVDAATNTIKLKDTVASGSNGTRTFDGLINVSAQPASLAGFGDLTLITKAYLSGQVSSEASTRLEGDNSIAAGLSSELVARASADTAEASTRLAADNSIAAGLSTELVDRASADASIAANLSTEKGRIDAILLASDADKDSFAEIVSLINSVDTENDTAFAAYVLSNDAALSSELVARASGDASLEVALSTSVSTANASIDAAISSEISDRVVAIDNEASIRLSADESIESVVGYNDAGTLHVGHYQEYLSFLAYDYTTGIANNLTQLDELSTLNGTNLNASIGTPISIPGLVYYQQNINGSAYESNGSYYITLADANEVQSMYDLINALTTLVNNILSNNQSLQGLQTEVSPENLVNFEAWKRWNENETLNTEITRAQSAEDSLATSLSSELSRAESVEAVLSSALSSEISRAEAAEGSLEIALSSEVSYLLENTDLTSIDSFAEVSAALSTQVSDFQAIYFHKASFSGAIDSVNDQFTLASSVRGGSETVYLNGLLQEAGVDYTVAGDVITFTSVPQTGDKVVIYAVY